MSAEALEWSGVQEEIAEAPPPSDDRRVGLIAGSGRLPLLIARGMASTGKEVCTLSLQGACDPEIRTLSVQYRTASIARLGGWVRAFRSWDVREAVMVGRVEHTTKYQSLGLLRYLPDLRTIRFWCGTVRHDRRTSTLLTTLADYLESHGVALLDNRTYIPDHLATPGVMTSTQPGTRQMADIEFAWPLLQQASDLNIGQSMAVLDRDVIAVEAAEGTDAMIRRAGELCGKRPWVLLKTSAADHDMRADVATVGSATLRNLKEAGAAALVLGVGRVIMLDKPEMLSLADELGIAVIGVGPPRNLPPELRP